MTHCGLLNSETLEPEVFKRVSWRNGAGFTTEMYAQMDVDADQLLWRLSMADVDSDGPFSDFNGYDRTLVLIAGNGLTLRHDDQTHDNLSRRFDAASFDGGSKTNASLHDGPIRDFNVISRSGPCTHSVTIAGSDNGEEVNVDADVLLVFAIDAQLRVLDAAGHSIDVAKGNLLKVDDAIRGRWQFQGSPSIIVEIHNIP